MFSSKLSKSCGGGFKPERVLECPILFCVGEELSELSPSFLGKNPPRVFRGEVRGESALEPDQREKGERVYTHTHSINVIL